jgi:TPR repeat protein
MRSEARETHTTVLCAWDLQTITAYNNGDLKKAKFHVEAAAMAGHEVARCNLGILEANSGNADRDVKHWMIDASAGHYVMPMQNLRNCYENGLVSRDSIDSTLAAYNTSCDEMRSEARDICIRIIQEREYTMNNNYLVVLNQVLL